MFSIRRGRRCQKCRTWEKRREDGNGEIRLTSSGDDDIFRSICGGNRQYPAGKGKANGIENRENGRTLDGETSIRKPHGQIASVEVSTSECGSGSFGRFVITEHRDISSSDDFSNLGTIHSNFLQDSCGGILSFGEHLDYSNVVRSQESGICRVVYDVSDSGRVGRAKD